MIREDVMKILSLGWGVQSFTLAAMAALREIEPFDVAVHSDTTHEASWTYDFASRWSPWLKEKGVTLITVKPDKIKLFAINEYKGVSIPAFTSNKNGKAGQLRRQCTGDWKIDPMRRYFQSIRNGKPIELWIGISLDEFQRMKPDAVKYIRNRYPLIEKRMTRNDCKKWIIEHEIEVPKRSSCVFCPFHDTDEWRAIKNSQVDFNAAVEHDEAIRKVRPPFDLFIHPSRKPLREVDFRTEQEKGQMSLWDGECSGICGV